MNRFRACLIAVIAQSLALTSCPIAQAAPEQSRCTIVADDFEPHAARLARVDEHGLQYVDNTTGAAQSLPLDRLVRLESFPAPDAKAKAPGTLSGGFILLLRDGQRWSGAPGKLEGDDLEWNAPGIFAEQQGGASSGRVPLKSVVAIASILKSTPPDIDRAATSSAATQDEVRLTNGDVVAGVISASDGKALTSAQPDGQAVTVDWANVRLLRFASVAGQKVSDATRASPAYRISLRDGRIIDGDHFAIDGDQLEFSTTNGGRLRFPGGEGVVAIEHRGGRVRMIADVPPSSSSQSPYFPSGTAASSSGFDVRETSVVIGNRTYRESILARPRSLIRWNLDGSSKSFATRYGIPAGRPLADVTVRIRLDDTVVHERAHVKAGEVIDLVRLPLGSAKTLSLEVDYGDAYDVQDDLYWLDPALLSQ